MASVSDPARNFIGEPQATKGVLGGPLVGDGLLVADEEADETEEVSGFCVNDSSSLSKSAILLFHRSRNSLRIPALPSTWCVTVRVYRPAL